MMVARNDSGSPSRSSQLKRRTVQPSFIKRFPRRRSRRNALAPEWKAYPSSSMAMRRSTKAMSISTGCPSLRRVVWFGSKPVIPASLRIETARRSSSECAPFPVRSSSARMVVLPQQPGCRAKERSSSSWRTARVCLA
jgi:hypothetical protein